MSVLFVQIWSNQGRNIHQEAPKPLNDYKQIHELPCIRGKKAYDKKSLEKLCKQFKMVYRAPFWRGTFFKWHLDRNDSLSTCNWHFGQMGYLETSNLFYTYSFISTLKIRNHLIGVQILSYLPQITIFGQIMKFSDVPKITLLWSYKDARGKSFFMCSEFKGEDFMYSLQFYEHLRGDLHVPTSPQKLRCFSFSFVQCHTYFRDLNDSYYVNQINYLGFLILFLQNNFCFLINCFQNYLVLLLDYN